MMVVLFNNIEFIIAMVTGCVISYKLGRRVQKWGWRGTFKSHKLST